MSVSYRKARDFVYGTGTLAEQSLFGWLFENRSLEHLHQTLRPYKNPDNGWGHGLEHDLSTPDSHPAALEYLLSLIRLARFPHGDLLDGSPQWLENHQNEDGSLTNPDTLEDYPLAPWWKEWGGQKIPASLVGNLTSLGLSTPKLDERTRRWVQANITLEKIKANEWLFAAYHNHDYFFQVENFPDVETYRKATLENIIECARKMPERQFYTLFHYALWPDSIVSQALPRELIDRSLDEIMATQRDDGGWKDEHGLAQWYPTVTTQNLLALRNYGKLTI